jgi:hypothetical protein
MPASRPIVLTRALLVAGALLAALALAGCGAKKAAQSGPTSSSPATSPFTGTLPAPAPGASAPQGTANPIKHVLSAPQQATLAAASAKLLGVADVSTPGLTARATAATTACAKLDTSQPLLAALARTCAPQIKLHKLLAVLPTRCATQNAICVKTLHRTATTATQLGAAQRAYAALAKRTVPSPACVSALTAGAAQRSILSDLASQASSVARAATSKDPGAAGAAQNGLVQLRTTLGNPNLDGGPIAVRAAALKRACGL